MQFRASSTSRPLLALRTAGSMLSVQCVTCIPSSLSSAMNFLMGSVYSQYRLNTFGASSLQAIAGSGSSQFPIVVQHARHGMQAVTDTLSRGVRGCT